jgi:hypothetical protein
MKLACQTEGRWRVSAIDAAHADVLSALVHYDYPHYAHEQGGWGVMPDGVEALHGGNRANVYKVTVDGRVFCLKVFHDRRLYVRVRNGTRW